MHIDTFKVLLYKNKVNDYSLVDIADRLSSKTMKYILNDLGIGYEAHDQTKASSNTMSNKVYIFTDGNCKRNGKSDAKAAYGIYFNDKSYSHMNRARLLETKSHTNQKAELQAVLELFKTLNANVADFKDKHIVICTDSMYAINCVTKWSQSWKKNNYKTSKGEEVKNADTIKSILVEIEKCELKFEFKHVMSHTQEPIDKTSVQYLIWQGNFIVDAAINKLLEN